MRTIPMLFGIVALFCLGCETEDGKSDDTDGGLDATVGEWDLPSGAGDGAGGGGGETAGTGGTAGESGGSGGAAGIPEAGGAGEAGNGGADAGDTVGEDLFDGGGVSDGGGFILVDAGARRRIYEQCSSDDDCESDLFCRTGYNHCTKNCTEDTDCPQPANASAVTGCSSSIMSTMPDTCRLDCADANGDPDNSACPPGMECTDTGFSAGLAWRCVFPDS